VIFRCIAAPDAQFAKAPHKKDAQGTPRNPKEREVMSLVGNCKFNYFAAQMTTHGAAWMLEVNSIVTLV
jgi:hypothetical protein